MVGLRPVGLGDATSRPSLRLSGPDPPYLCGLYGPYFLDASCLLTLPVRRGGEGGAGWSGGRRSGILNSA